jgi:hypothetical protein
VRFGTVEKLVARLEVVIDRLETRGREEATGAKLAETATCVKWALTGAIRWWFLLLIAISACALASADSALRQTDPTLRVRDYEGIITATEALAQNASACKEQLTIVVRDERAASRRWKTLASATALWARSSYPTSRPPRAACGKRRVELGRLSSAERIRQSRTSPPIMVSPRVALTHHLSRYAFRRSFFGSTAD